MKLTASDYPFLDNPALYDPKKPKDRLAIATLFLESINGMTQTAGTPIFGQYALLHYFITLWALNGRFAFDFGDPVVRWLRIQFIAFCEPAGIRDPSFHPSQIEPEPQSPAIN